MVEIIYGYVRAYCVLIKICLALVYGMSIISLGQGVQGDCQWIMSFHELN